MENEIDIFGVTDTFRQCRQAIIQTKDQYFYAYKAVRSVRLLGARLGSHRVWLDIVSAHAEQRRHLARRFGLSSSSGRGC